MSVGPFPPGAGDGPNVEMKSDILSHVSEIAEAVRALKTEILDLQRVRDQARVHLRFFQTDYARLKELFSHIKHQIEDEPTKTFESPSSLSMSSPEQRDVPPSTSPIETAQMNLVDLQWQVASHSPSFRPQDLSLRFSLSTSAVLCTVQFDPSGECIAFSDGRHLHVVSASNGALMYSIEIPKSPSRNELHTRVLRFSHDGRLIALSSMASSVSLFSTESKKCIGNLEGHSKAVTALLFMKSSKLLLSGSSDGRMCVWDVDKMTLVRCIQHGNENNGGRLNREGAIVSLATDSEESCVTVGFMNGCVGIYEPTFTQPMNTFSAHSEYLLSVETVPDASAVVTTSHDTTAKLWMLRGIATCKHTFTGHSDYVLSVTMTKNNPLMVTGSKDETIKGWNRKSGELLFTINGHRNTLFELHHHPSQKAFVSCSGDGLVCVWEYQFAMKEN